MRARVIVFVLLFLVFGFLAMSTSIRFAKPAINEANAQATCCPSAAPTTGPAYTINEFSALAFRASPGGVGNTNGAVMVVTSSATEQSSIIFYYQCAPNSSLGANMTPSKCPQDGFVVYSAPICTAPAVTGVLTCPTTP